MKIYEIGTGYTPIPAQMGAATEIVVEELVKAFQKQNIKVELLDIKTKKRKPNNLPIVDVWVPCCFAGTDVKLGVMHKLKRVIYSVALAGKLKKILRNAKEPVMLHFHNQYNLFFFLMLVPPKIRAKAKIAYTVHSYVWPGDWDEIKETIHKRYFQEVFCVRKADYVLVLNEITAEHFVNHLSVEQERIYKIGNGVNTDIYHRQTTDEVEVFKESIGLAGKRIILQVGSVCDRKNQLGALVTLKDYLHANSDVIFAYAGGVIDSEYQMRITAWVKENRLEEQVRYMGEISPGVELNHYYNAAELTVFPSKVESFGLVIIESLAAGTPVLAANKPLFALEYGYDVFDSDEEFLDKVQLWLEKKHDDSAARAEVCANYSWERVACDHLDIWRR